MKILCVFGEHNYGDPTRGQGYEYSNFIPAFRRLGHEVVFFESLNKEMYASFADLNYRFLITVEKERPDIIFCVLMGYELWLESLELVRKSCESVLINWATDDSWKYEQFSRFMAASFHAYATTYSEAFSRAHQDNRKNVILTQWAANAERLAEPLPAARCRYPVSFVGSAYGNRSKWVDALRKYGIEVICFGHGWENGPVPAEEIPRIIRESVISLNFGDSGLVMNGLLPRRSRQIKARVFEVPGAGGFLMTEHAEDLEKFYLPGKELVLFDGVTELAAKINFFLSNPEERDKVAWAGHLRTRREHTYDLRFKQLLKDASQLGAMRTGETDLEKSDCHINFSKFAALERAHRAGYFLRILKILLHVPCIVIWGRQRGPRAARRLFFELSWRILGKKTYSASGWPGRIFYRES